MAIQDITTLKSYFETGDRPTQQQFWDLIDSLVHRFGSHVAGRFTGNLIPLNNLAGLFNTTQVLTGEITLDSFVLGGKARFIHKDAVLPSFLQSNKVRIILGSYEVGKFNTVHVICWDETNENVDVIISSLDTDPIVPVVAVEISIDRISDTEYEITSINGPSVVDLEFEDDSGNVEVLNNVNLPHIHTSSQVLKVRGKSGSGEFSEWYVDYAIHCDGGYIQAQNEDVLNMGNDGFEITFKPISRSGTYSRVLSKGISSNSANSFFVSYVNWSKFGAFYKKNKNKDLRNITTLAPQNVISKYIVSFNDKGNGTTEIIQSIGDTTATDVVTNINHLPDDGIYKFTLMAQTDGERVTKGIVYKFLHKETGEIFDFKEGQGSQTIGSLGTVLSFIQNVSWVQV